MQLISLVLLLVGSLANHKSLADSGEWWRREIVYQVYPRSFRDSNGDGVGDIRGIIEKLDYVMSTGAKAIWLSPIYPSPMVDFGYDISDFNDVDPLFGTLEDFDQLVQEMHKRGMYLIMDLVPNHTSDKHRWFLESRKSRVGPYADYYVWVDCQPPESPDSAPIGVNNWLGNFGGSAWAYDSVRKQCYLHQFAVEQPDLNFKSERVRAEMRDVVSFWLRRGVDGFRLDAIRHMFEDERMRDEPKAVGDNWRTDDPTDYFHLLHPYTTDLSDTYGVIAEWRRLLNEESSRTGKRYLLMAEAYSPQSVLPLYYKYEGKLLTDFPFNFALLEASMTRKKFCNSECLLQAANDYLAHLPDGACANWVLGNHDNSRMASRFPPAGRFAVALNTLLLLLPGMPTCYYGDELGMTDTQLRPDQMVDPLGRRFPSQSRDPARSPMPWSNATAGGFTDSKVQPWLPLQSNFADICVERQSQLENSTLNAFRRVSALRRQPEFVEGDLKFLVNDKDVLAFSRGKGWAGRTYIVLLHISQADTVAVSNLGISCRSVSLVFEFRSHRQLMDSSDSLAVATRPGDALVFLVDNCIATGESEVKHKGSTGERIEL